MTNNEIPKILDISILSGTEKRLPKTNKYNILRDYLNRNTHICWACPKLGVRCCNVKYIFSCNNVKHLINNLKKEDYYEKP